MCIIDFRKKFVTKKIKKGNLLKKNNKNLGTLSVYKLLMSAYNQSLDTCIFSSFY